MSKITMLMLIFLVFAIVFFIGVMLGFASALEEDQIIVCVSGHVVDKKGLICHLYNVDDLDWYQDAYDGSLFKLDDSFNMRIDK